MLLSGVFFFSNESSVFVTFSVLELVRSTKASDQPGGSMGMGMIKLKVSKMGSL